MECKGVVMVIMALSKKGPGFTKMLQAERRRNVAGADDSRQFILRGPPSEAASPSCLILSNPASLYLLRD